MGRKSNKEHRRKEIIEVFYKVAKVEGLENTSIAKIAAELECNPSLIIHYFDSKEELIFGLIEYILDAYSDLFKPDHHDIESKEDILLIIDQLFSSQWNTLINDGVFYSCYALTFKNDNIKNKFRKLHLKLRAKLEGVLIVGNEKGLINIKDTASKSELFFVILEGAYYYLSLFKNQHEYTKKMDEYKKLAMSLLEIE